MSDTNEASEYFSYTRSRPKTQIPSVIVRRAPLEINKQRLTKHG